MPADLFDPAIDALLANLADGNLENDPQAWDDFHQTTLAAMAGTIEAEYLAAATAAMLPASDLWARQQAKDWLRSTLAVTLIHSVGYTRQRVHQIATQRLQAGLPQRQVWGDVRDFLDYHWNEVILVSETTDVKADAVQDANARYQGIGLEWEVHSLNPCPLCEVRHGVVAVHWDDPPKVHTGCKCTLKPVKIVAGVHPELLYPDHR